MAIETTKATEIEAVAITPQEREALIVEPPVLALRLIRMVFGVLETRNPLLRAQLDRVKRRLLALNRLEFRALRAAWWEDRHERTLASVLAEKESFVEDPSLIVSKLDGHLTWIENASPAEIAREARKLPEAIVAMECVVDLAGHRVHPHGDGEHDHEARHGHAAIPISAGSVSHIRRQITRAFFDVIACREPNLADRTEKVKQRLLALSPVRMRALRATLWQDKQHKPLSGIVAKLESWFEHPAERLDHLEQRLDAVEGLSSQAVEEQAALLPKSLLAFEDMP